MFTKHFFVICLDLVVKFLQCRDRQTTMDNFTSDRLTILANLEGAINSLVFIVLWIKKETETYYGNWVDAQVDLLGAQVNLLVLSYSGSILNFCCKIIVKRNIHESCWNERWAPSSEFVSSSIPSWQILTAHAQPFRGARDLAFCLKVPLDSLLVWASSEGSGDTARMRRLAWTFAARIRDKYQIWSR